MARLLFIAPEDLCDTVLASGPLAHVLAPEQQLFVAGHERARALLAAAPGFAGAPTAAFARGAGGLASQRYDLVLDAGGRLAGRLAPARRRIVLKPAPGPQRLELWSRAVGAERALAPRLWLDGEARRCADAIAPVRQPLLALAPGGGDGELWPAHKFAAIARRLAGGPLAGACVAALAPAGEREFADAVAASLEADGVAARVAELAPLAGAALLERATLCIAHDNAFAYLAAAAGAATLTLSATGEDGFRAPVGVRARMLRGGDIDAAEAAALELLHAGGVA